MQGREDVVHSQASLRAGGKGRKRIKERRQFFFGGGGGGEDEHMPVII